MEKKELKWERRKKVGYAPSIRSGCTMTLWANKDMGVLFGGVKDDDQSEETLVSEFYNDMWVLVNPMLVLSHRNQYRISSGTVTRRPETDVGRVSCSRRRRSLQEVPDARRRRQFNSLSYTIRPEAVTMSTTQETSVPNRSSPPHLNLSSLHPTKTKRMCPSSRCLAVSSQANVSKSRL